AGFFDGGPAGALEVGAHGFGDDVGEGSFAQTRRAAEEDVVEGFFALARGLDGEFESFLDAGLAGEFRKERRAEGQFQHGVGLGEDIGHSTIGHGKRMSEEWKGARGKRGSYG